MINEKPDDDQGHQTTQQAQAGCAPQRPLTRRLGRGLLR